MDKASIIGVLIGLAAMGIVFVEVSHGNLMMFFSGEGVLMVGFGSVSVVFMAMPMERIKSVPGYIRRFLFHKGMAAVEVIKLLA
jgi:flagellar motor component MotA